MINLKKVGLIFRPASHVLCDTLLYPRARPSIVRDDPYFPKAGANRMNSPSITSSLYLLKDHSLHLCPCSNHLRSYSEKTSDPLRVGAQFSTGSTEALDISFSQKGRMQRSTRMRVFEPSCECFYELLSLSEKNDQK